MAVYYKEEDQPHTPWSYRYKRKAVQTAPINRSLVLPYRTGGFKNVGNYGSTSPRVHGMCQTYSGSDGPAYAEAYDKLFKSIRGGSRAALAITAFEWKSSLGMIASRASAVLKGANALRRGNVYGALRHWSVKDPKLKAKRFNAQRGFDNFANTFLELNFGWGPLLDDIANATRVLTQDIPVERFSGTGRQLLEYHYFKDYGGGEFWSEDAMVIKKIRLFAEMAGVNPNKFIASQLGLTNPAHVAWDAVPLSFVADWFLPIGKYLGQFDSQVGINLKNCGISVSCKGTGDYIFNAPSAGRVETTFTTADAFSREPVTDFRFPDFWERMKPLSSSLWQAATSITLLYQMISGEVRKAKR